MENIGYQSPFAADAHGYEEPEETLEKMMRALYGGLDSEEMEDLRARQGCPGHPAEGGAHGGTEGDVFGDEPGGFIPGVYLPA